MCVCRLYRSYTCKRAGVDGWVPLGRGTAYAHVHAEMQISGNINILNTLCERPNLEETLQFASSLLSQAHLLINRPPLQQKAPGP